MGPMWAVWGHMGPMKMQTKNTLVGINPVWAHWGVMRPQSAHKDDSMMKLWTRYVNLWTGNWMYEPRIRVCEFVSRQKSNVLVYNWNCHWKNNYGYQIYSHSAWIEPTGHQMTKLNPSFPGRWSFLQFLCCRKKKIVTFGKIEKGIHGAKSPSPTHTHAVLRRGWRFYFCCAPGGPA